MISVVFPDGREQQYEKGVAVLNVVNSISTTLTKKTVCALVNGKVVDLQSKLEENCTIKFLTLDTKDANEKKEILHVMRHSCAHLFAQAMRELYDNKVHFAFGPATETGFYYDFELDDDVKITTEDFPKIEKKMHELAEKKFDIIRRELTADEAEKEFKQAGEKYKVEHIVEDLKVKPSIQSGEEKISAYTQGNFTDLCRGPHVMNTGFLKHFKLMKVSGAYWRADAKNAMLQRVYGTCWSTKEELDNYLKMLEEAEKRDHRKLGQQLDLFHLQEEAPGCAFWHPRGWTLYLLLQNYIREKIKKHGYIEVKTPQIVSKTLWEKSGHWTKYREHMFITRIDEEDMDFAIKPMNCPCHVEIFKNKIRSYKDLPIRMAEFGKCHRYEPSGSLHGLMRVRGFVQDDAHIFCTEEQIAGETIAFYKLLKEVYSDFGFDNIKVKFSDRPEMRVGSDELWDKAEKALREPMEQAGVELELNKGEGAFYGPKLEFVLKDAIGREWQCGTFQVDFNLGQRLGAEYVDEDGSKKPPVMLHRAVLGSFERFIAILIEHFAGAFPVWLAPVQAVVIGVNNELDGEVLKIVKKLQDAGVRCEADLSKETVSYKVRRQSEMKVPYIITIGNREVEDGTLSVRKFGEMKNETVGFEEFTKLF